MGTLRVHCFRVFQLPLCIGKPIQIHITTRVSIQSAVKMNNSYMLHHKKLNTKCQKKRQQLKIAVRSVTQQQEEGKKKEKKIEQA